MRLSVEIHVLGFRYLVYQKHVVNSFDLVHFHLPNFDRLTIYVSASSFLDRSCHSLASDSFDLRDRNVVAGEREILSVLHVRALRFADITVADLWCVIGENVIRKQAAWLGCLAGRPKSRVI